MQLEREAARHPAHWIWIHHAPPTGARTNWTGKRAIGDEYLHAWIERYQPDMVLSGHIHNAPFFEQGSWFDRIGRTWVFNPGRMIGAEPTSVLDRHRSHDRRVALPHRPPEANQPRPGGVTRAASNCTQSWRDGLPPVRGAKRDLCEIKKRPSS